MKTWELQYSAGYGAYDWSEFGIVDVDVTDEEYALIRKNIKEGVDLNTVEALKPIIDREYENVKEICRSQIVLDECTKKYVDETKDIFEQGFEIVVEFVNKLDFMLED